MGKTRTQNVYLVLLGPDFSSGLEDTLSVQEVHLEPDQVVRQHLRGLAEDGAADMLGLCLGAGGEVHFGAMQGEVLCCLEADSGAGIRSDRSIVAGREA